MKEKAEDIALNLMLTLFSLHVVKFFSILKKLLLVCEPEQKSHPLRNISPGAYTSAQLLHSDIFMYFLLNLS